MSIDVHEAIKAIRDMLPIIDPEEDYLTIVAAEESIATSEAKRKKQLEEAHANLKALSRALEAARVSSTRPTSVPSAEAHATLLNELDSSRLSLMKAISDTEGMITNREAELARLKEEARQLEDYDPALEHEKELDSTTLRLQLYKGLGFEPVTDKNGAVTKMLVSSKSGDIHTVDLNSDRSDHETTELLWRLASS
ncbi:hypothetical protein AX17_005096 [Amanita inopinata Kibby_2008]|nr:hypothetical protein AX17_005096 [Amanita inopinata Kibby_2008]